MTFDYILELYFFDRGLRLIVFDAIERIEIAIRSQLNNQLAQKYGSHWQDNPGIFKRPEVNGFGKPVYVFEDTQNIIQKHLDMPKPEVFIAHYKRKYSDPKNPPCWMAIELLTIGELSRLYGALLENIDRKEIASYFGLHHTVFSSWLHTLVYVRNICAHHSRLWNRELAIKPVTLLKSKMAWLEPIFNGYADKTFYFLSILKYLLVSANPKCNLKSDLIQLIEKYPTVPVHGLGIPKPYVSRWHEQPIWSL